MILKNADFILTIGHYYQHLLTPDIEYVVAVNLWLSATLMVKILWSRNLSKRLTVTIYNLSSSSKELQTNYDNMILIFWMNLA